MERSTPEVAEPVLAPGRWSAHPLGEVPAAAPDGRWTLRGRSPELVLLSPGSAGRRLFGWGTAFVVEAEGGLARLLDGRGRELDRVFDRGPLLAAARMWERWSAQHRADPELPGPYAMGAFAFDLGRPLGGAWAGAPQLRLTVPAELLVVEEGRGWLLTGGQSSPELDQLRFEPSPPPSAPWLGLGSGLGELGAEWSSEVDRALEAIRTKVLRKVVLAQELALPLGRALDPELMAEQLRAAAPESWTYRIPVAPGKVFVGSSPELLLRGSAGELESWPLAGTLAIDADDAAEVGRRFSASDKNLREHQAVVEQVTTALSRYCQELDYPSQPQPVLFPGIAHLGTRIRGRIQPPAPVLEVLAQLHPTPAVAGTPVGAAMALIRELENFDRGWYAGGVGWVGPGGVGEFALAIRSALLTAEMIRLFAGCGIVAGSDAAQERAELELKLGSVLRPLLGPGQQLLDRRGNRPDGSAASLRAVGGG